MPQCENCILYHIPFDIHCENFKSHILHIVCKINLTHQWLLCRRYHSCIFCLEFEKSRNFPKTNQHHNRHPRLCNEYHSLVLVLKWYLNNYFINKDCVFQLCHFQDVWVQKMNYFIDAFITLFTRGHLWSLSRTRCIQGPILTSFLFQFDFDIHSCLPRSPNWYLPFKFCK
jgi:hypothetical protein